MSLYLQKSPVYLQKSAFACIFADESAYLEISFVLANWHTANSLFGISPMSLWVSHSWVRNTAKSLFGTRYG